MKKRREEKRREEKRRERWQPIEQFLAGRLFEMSELVLPPFEERRS